MNYPYIDATKPAAAPMGSGLGVSSAALNPGRLDGGVPAEPIAAVTEEVTEPVVEEVVEELPAEPVVTPAARHAAKVPAIP